MLAKLIALTIVGLAVLGPASYLLWLAWLRGGLARKVAIAVLCLAGALVAWLMAPIDPAMTREEHISQFVGAWGILFAGVGVLAIAATVFGKFRPPGPRDEED